MRHSLTRYDPGDGEPVSELCDCAIGADHEAPSPADISSKASAAAAQMRAAVAMRRARERWPGAVGLVLADEISRGYVLLPWLGPTSRTVALIEQILDQPEEDARQAH